MNVIDNYGDFDLPEEKSVVEVIEDPVKVIISCYDLFKKISKCTIKNSWYGDDNTVKQLYEESLKIFVEKTELKPDAGQLEEIINELRKKAEELDGTGVFLSALVNTTKISMLFVGEFPKLDQIGYRLKKNKTIILGPKNTSFELGGFAEGNTINQGTTTYQGYNASGGNHINQGTIQQYQGYNASGGNHINQGTIQQYQGYNARGGNHIIQGTTTHQGWYASGGNHINIKTVKEIKGKLVIDLSQKQHPLKSQLEQKLDELDFLKTKDADRLIQLINDYDWKKFDIQLNEICEKIKKVYLK